MSASISSTGTVTTTQYGVTVDSEGNVDLSGLVDRTMNALDIHAPKFVNQMLGIAAEAEASTLAIEGAVSAAAAALPAEVGGAVAALGAFAPVAAVVLVIPAILYAVVGAAQGGTGCCGTAPYTRAQAIEVLQALHDPLRIGGDSSYTPSESDIHNLMTYSGQGATAPPCDPSQYEWPVYTESTSPGEQFINATIKAAYKQRNGCWSTMTAAEYMVALATGIGIWNRAHSSQRTINVNGRSTTLGPTFVSRMVNVTENVSFGGSSYPASGQAEGADPISQALNFASMKIDPEGQGQGFLVKPNALASFNLNEGPTVPPGSAQALVHLSQSSAAFRALANLMPAKPSSPAPVVQVRASGPVSPAVAPVVTSAWDKQQPWLGGATPKQAGIFAGVATAGTWLLRAVLRRF